MARRAIPSAKLIARVQKLKALAASPSEHEAESAAAQCMKLMREHALTQADLDAAAREAEDPLVERRSYLDGTRCLRYEEKSSHVYQVSAWKRQLFGAVSDYFGLRWSYVPGTAILTFYGFLSDVNAAADLYEVCARQIDRQCSRWLGEEKARRKARGEWWGLEAGEARTLGFEFRESAVRGLRSKFDELTREAASCVGMTEEETAREVERAAAEGRPPRLDAPSSWGLVLDRRQKVANWVDATYTFKKGTGDGMGGDKGFNPAGYEVGTKLRLTEDPSLPGGGRSRITSKSRLLGEG